MKRLDGNVALVTGGASGIGLAIAKRLKSEGANVVISDIDDERGQDVAKSHGLVFLRQDVTDEAQWERTLAELERRFVHFDILVNNAGVVGARDAVSPETSRLTDWRQLFTINVESVFLGCRAAIAAMRRTGKGSIVNLSSIAGLTATPDAMAYGASKAAVWQMTKSVAQYCAEQGLAIRCNSVHPGNVHGPLWDQVAAEAAQARGVTPEAIIAEAAAGNPLGGFSSPEDVAAAVAYLVSDDAARVTGSQLLVDGGSVGCDTFHLSDRFRSTLLRAAEQSHRHD